MSAPSPDAPGLGNWVRILVLGFVWGGAFLSTKLALDGFGPWTVAAGRVVIAAAVLTVVAGLAGQLRGLRGVAVWVHVVAFAAVSVAVALMLLAWGQQHVTSAFAGVAMGAVPLIVLPLAAAFSPGERVTRWKVAGVALGFVGLAVLVGPEAMQARGGAWELWGRLACIGTAACYAIGSIITRRCPPVPPLGFAAVTLLVGAVMVLPVALWFEGVPRAWPVVPGLALLWAGVGPTALGAMIRVQVIRSAGSVFMSMTSYMVPVWAVILGWALLGEVIGVRTLAGLVLILAGIGLAQLRRA